MCSSGLRVDSGTAVGRGTTVSDCSRLASTVVSISTGGWLIDHNPLAVTWRGRKEQ
jgi:hypothetical protein